MSRVSEQIRLTHANVTLSDHGGIRDWKHLLLNAQDDEPRPKLEPWQNLCLAILNDAIETLKRGPTSPKNKRNWAYPATEKWFHGSAANYSIFGFVAICEAFNWSPSWVRKGIIAMVDKAREINEPQIKRQRFTVRGQYRRPSGPKPKRRDAYGVK